MGSESTSTRLNRLRAEAGSVVRTLLKASAIRPANG